MKIKGKEENTKVTQGNRKKINTNDICVADSDTGNMRMTTRRKAWKIENEIRKEKRIGKT